MAGIMIDDMGLENFYKQVEEKIAGELERLAQNGTRTACSAGCFHCCNQDIVLSQLEMRGICDYIEKNFDDSMKKALYERCRLWCEVDGFQRMGQVYEKRLFCPLLVDGLCSVYPVRPLICRAHLVSNSPLYCYLLSDDNGMLNSKGGDNIIVLSTIKRLLLQDEAKLEKENNKENGSAGNNKTLIAHGLDDYFGWELGKYYGEKFD